MLGKLIKYDFKASAKIFILFHAAFILACLLCRILFVDHLRFDAPIDPLVTSIAVFSSLMIFLCIAVNFATWLQITFRFYRNLFSREGYLSWTLPVSGVQQLWGKIISGYIFMAVDIIVIAGGILLLVTAKNITTAYSSIAPEMTEALGMPLSTLAFYLFLFCLVSGISAVIMSYFCIAVGQLFPGHRVLCAVAAYFITSFVVQIFSLIVMAVSGIFPGYNFLPDTGTAISDYLFNIFALSGVLSFIVTVIQYIVTHYIMKKKINLI